MRGTRTPAHLSVDEILEALARGAASRLSSGVTVSQLDHALQTAALLAHRYPDDTELAVAGLVHDVGHMLPGGRDETHADDAASAVGRALGPRVAGIVALHVEAKRYLVATEDEYGGVLAGDSVVSLRRQGGAMDAEEAGEFLGRPWARDAVTLRRADDGAKVDGLEVRDLTQWVSTLRQLSGLPGVPGAEATGRRYLTRRRAATGQRARDDGRRGCAGHERVGRRGRRDAQWKRQMLGSGQRRRSPPPNDGTKEA